MGLYNHTSLTQNKQIPCLMDSVGESTLSNRGVGSMGNALASWCKHIHRIGAPSQSAAWLLLGTTHWVHTCLIWTVQQNTNRGHSNTVWIISPIITMAVCLLQSSFRTDASPFSKVPTGFVIITTFCLSAENSIKVFRGASEHSDLTRWRLTVSMHALFYTPHFAIWGSAAL